MKFSVLKITATELELELDERDPTLVELIAEKLSSMKEVDVAAPKWDHPLVGQPKLYLRVKKGAPIEVLKSAIKDLIEEFKELKDAIK